MTVAVICAGGPENEVVDMQQFLIEDSVFIGADRGALHLLRQGIIPMEAVGDFDSVTNEEYEEIRTQVKKMDAFQAEKNETDTELAIERALSYHPTKVILTGVTGGRLDHMLSALQLLYRVQTAYQEITFKICNNQNELMILLPGEYRILPYKQLQYVSFFSFHEPVSALTLRGFKYDTTKERLESGMTMFTSNELLEQEGSISFPDGICLMVRSSDA